MFQLLDLNVRALTHLTRHFLAGMRVRGRGGILNLGSIGGFGPGPNQAVYYATKAYVHSFSEAIAHETAGQGVRVTVLAPGPVRTRFHAKMGAEHALYRLFTAPGSVETAARAGYLAFALGLRVVVPGILDPFLALAVRILPHRIVIPIVGLLLRPMGRGPKRCWTLDLPKRSRSPRTAPPARPGEREGGGRHKKPVCIVLHQENSNPGHVGQWFVRNGYPLDIRKPRFGEPLPETLRDHCGAVVFGGPMSANDKDAFILRETQWIKVALEEEKPYLGICLGAQMLTNFLGRQGRVPPGGAGRDRLLPAPYDAGGHGARPLPRPRLPVASRGLRAGPGRAAARHVRTAAIPTRPSPIGRRSACSSTPRSPTPRCTGGPGTATRAST